MEGWHPGIVGLVAARLRERFDRPAFAIALSEGGGTGSGRSVPGVDLGAAVRLAVTEGLLVKGGGHGMAAGVTLQRERLDDFRAFLERHCRDDVARLRSDAALAVDATLSAGAVTADLIDALAAAGPFGAGSPEPLIVLPVHRVVDHAVVGDGHCRVTLAARDGCRIKAVAFRSVGTPLAKGLAAARGQLVHAAGSLTMNRWGGQPRAELRLVDAAPVTDRPAS